MKHVDEGSILALRDGASTDAGVAEHVESCHACAAEIERARGRATRVAAALAELDDALAAVDLEWAKSAVRRRLDPAGHERGRPIRSSRSALPKAAVLVLLAAGAASALPGSPLRSWWRAPEALTTGAVEPSPQEAARARAAALAVPLEEGRIAVVVRRAPGGASIEVAWTDGPEAGVSAPPGSSFAYGVGRIEVDAVSGPVRIQLPRGATLASVVVNGVEYVRRSGDEVEVMGQTIERSENLLRFSVPER